MKKILFILIVVLSSCVKLREGDIVRSVYVYDNENSVYKVKGTLSDNEFVARNGLYNIGDTIKFTR